MAIKKKTTAKVKRATRKTAIKKASKPKTSKKVDKSEENEKVKFKVETPNTKKETQMNTQNTVHEGNFAHHVSEVISNYFSKAYNTAIAATLALGILFTSGCAMIEKMTVDQKADLASTLARAATVSWIIIDTNSSKYTDTLEKIVKETKVLVNEAISEDPTMQNDFYEKVYAKIDAIIAQDGQDALVQELERSVAKFAIKETQKLILQFKTESVEDAVKIANGAFDGIIEGLNVKVGSAEYIAAVNEKNEQELENVKLSNMKLEAARK